MKKILSIVLLIVLALTLTACGGKKETAANVDLASVMSKFTVTGEMMALETADLASFYSIAAEDVKQCAATISTTGIDCEEIVLIEAVNADAAARVKSALDARYQAKLNETENYLPDEYAIIKTCSVASNGNYVSMIVAENAADLVKIYNESFK